MKYTDEQIATIKGACLAGLSHKAVAIRFKVPYSTVVSIMVGRQRADIEPNPSVAQALEALFNRREPA